MMARLGPLAKSKIWAGLKGVVERLITYLCWLMVNAALVGGAAKLVATKDAADAVDDVGVAGSLGAMDAVVLVPGTVVVLLVWFLD